MKYRRFSVFFILVVILISCSTVNQSRIELKITKHALYDNLSSASGVSVVNNKILLVGDDIPWLVQLNYQLEIADQFTLSGIDSIINSRMPYQLKPDYECMESFKQGEEDFTLILSSGSQNPTRDTAILVSHTNPGNLTKQNIRPLYDLIKTRAKIENEEINIEGLAMTDKSAYLFHRGNISGNFIAEISRKDLLHYIKTGHLRQYEFNIFSFNLPVYSGVRSGFSGACYFPEKESFLFTASLEDTKSVTSDGVVTGSYIGMIPLKTIEKGEYTSTMLKDDVKILAKKLEGISILSTSGNETRIVTVCDNDDGTSDVFLLDLKFED